MTLFRAGFVVSFYEAGADEKEVADADVAALGFGAEIYVLELCAGC